MKLNKLAAGLAFALALAAPLSAQTVVGSVDFVDRDSIVGWACYQNDASTLLGVDLWLLNTATSQWTYLDHTLANRERNDVGHSNLCGWGNNAFYHGFEYTIFPETVLASQGTYQVYASAANQLLPAPSTTISFAAAGLPTRGIWRTDYEDPNLRSVAMTSCIFPFKNANPIPGLNVDPDPRFLGAGATVLNPWEDYPGQISAAVWCVRNHRYDQNSWNWSQSNSATNSPTWPTSNYWVIAANNELAYSKTQSGPPNQSQPVNVPGGLYSVSMDKEFFFLGVNNTSAAYHLADTPYLSLGAQMGRGVAGPLAFIQPTGQDTYVDFQVKQLSETANDFHDVAVYVELMWGGYKRYLGVSLRQPMLGGRFHWNWNALESFWFPGGEFNILGTERITNHCYLGAQAKLPILSAATIGQSREVSIPLRALLQCIETAAIPNYEHYGGGYLGWDSARPTNLPIAITGLQIAVEQGPGQPYSVMQTRFTRPVLVNR